ncbi:alpha/beta hydrolase family protein [Sphingobacterium faecale]|uniref:Prolyl oligopeptidase family serine peptidase n=1 Tax=Sphingobacterium faecale TaxID=2803775 RepID=A0ABS1R2Z1_9SPHI|nr:prolyl oligopeptidase family serine peptidase [Sphingobacterium faecale]
MFSGLRGFFKALIPDCTIFQFLAYCIKTILKEEKRIDRGKLGLIGYSFGGYATNFIITQICIFKTAVSGFGSGDIINSYFSYNEIFTSPNYFLFENGQFNLGSFKENKELFLLNSPILFAHQIKTPLLGFAGKEDRNVEWKLQQEFFIALLRFRKPHISFFTKMELMAFQRRKIR